LELPHGENALIYGENGAGKSSLFHSVRDFLEASHRSFFERDRPEALAKRRELRLLDHQFRPKVGDPLIQLSFDRSVFTWDTAQDAARSGGPWDAVISATDKGKGFLDYRALLRVHFLPGQEGGGIDIFNQLIEQLLPHYTYYHSASWGENRFRGLSGSGERTFAQGWSDLQRRLNQRHYLEEHNAFNAARRAFDEALKKQVEGPLAETASQFAKRFDARLTIAFKVEPSNYTDRPRKTLHAPKVYVYVPPNGERGQVVDYDRFFNEARLTAIALSIFFAALINSPATGQRLLALDDILIGLDMAHRLEVLRILEDHFKEWQVLIFTYHKAWFEILKERTSASTWRNPWKSFVVRQEQVRNSEISFVKHEESGLLLELADRYSARTEHKSAAVHARTAMEIIMARYCAKKRLSVRYIEDRNRQSNHDFLTAIHASLSRFRSPLRYATWEAIRKELVHSLRFVLHSYSHRSPEREDELQGEVLTAIAAVRRLEEFLNSIRQAELAPHPVPPNHRTFLWLIEDAVSTPLASQKQSALRALKHASEAFVLDELRRRSVPLKLAGSSDAWDVLFKSGMLTRGDMRVLTSSREYFKGIVPGDEFSEDSFSAALQTLLRIRLRTLLNLRAGGSV